MRVSKQSIIAPLLILAIPPCGLASTAGGSSIVRTVQSTAARSAETKVDDKTLSAEQVLDRYIKAIGGRAAIEAQTSRVMKGSAFAPGFGVRGTIEIYSKAPNKQLTEIAMPVVGESRVGFDGVNAWQDDNGVVTDLQLFARRDADFYQPIRLLQLYPKIEYKGSEKIGEREVLHLQAARGGRPKSWYFDVHSALLLRTEVKDSTGKLVNREDYEDYRAVDHILFPFTTRRIEADGTEIVITLSSITHNVTIEDSKFAKPPVKSATLDRREFVWRHNDQARG